jgi:MFS family permease
LGRVIAITAALGGAAMTLFAATNNLPLMLVTSVVAGFGMIVTFAASNTMLQTLVEDDMRARLMSFFIVAVMGAAPVGSLLAGWVADRIGDRVTVMLGGLISAVGAMLFMMKLPALRAMVRPIYIKRGILPDVASGLAAAQRVNVVEET